MFLFNKSFWKVKLTKKKGKGVFTKKEIPKGTVIGDYIGKLIKIEDVDFEKEKENLYLMNYNNSTGIYPNLKKPGVHLLNHSCRPNCFIYKYLDRTLVFTLRNIKKDEELTISYLLPPRKYCRPCTHKCFCGNINCTGSMHLTEKEYNKWQKFQNKNFGNRKTYSNKKTLKPLNNYPKKVPTAYVEGLTKLHLL